MIETSSTHVGIADSGPGRGADRDEGPESKTSGSRIRG